MKVPLLDLKPTYAALREEIRKAIDEVCDAQAFILGPKVEAFEKRVAAYSGARFAVGASSGTDAILLALMAFGIGPGDAVLTTPYTFFATAGCIVRTGATPVFVDIDPISFNLSPAQVRETLVSMPKRFPNLKPKALMPVHLYGQCADMAPLLEIAREHGLKVIEDAAQAIGAEYPFPTSGVEGQPRVARAGAMGDVGCFSFFPSKNLGGFGDGGMVTTQDAELAAVMRKIRNHGAEPKYYHATIGGNFRLDALQAVILDIKLNHLELWHEARRQNAERYTAALQGTSVCPPAAVYAGRGIRNHHIYNQYVVRAPDRDETMRRLRSADIGCEIYYPVPLHAQECFRGLGYRAGDMPESEKAAAETIALPIYPGLTAPMQEYVADVLLKA